MDLVWTPVRDSPCARVNLNRTQRVEALHVTFEGIQVDMMSICDVWHVGADPVTRFSGVLNFVEINPRCPSHILVLYETHYAPRLFM